MLSWLWTAEFSLFRKESVSFLHQEFKKKKLFSSFASSKGKDNSTLNFWPGTIFNYYCVNQKLSHDLYGLSHVGLKIPSPGWVTHWSPGTWAWMTSDYLEINVPHRPRPQSSKSLLPLYDWAGPIQTVPTACRSSQRRTHLCLGLHPAGHALRKADCAKC